MIEMAAPTIGIITYSLEIEERIAGLEAELASSRRAYNGLSERYNELSHEYAFVKDLFEVKADTLTVSHKASTFATVQYLKAHERDRDERGYIKMNTWEVAGMAGQSTGTVLNNWGATSRELRIHDGIEVETDIGRVPLFDRLVVRVPSSDRERYPQGYYLETYMKERALLSDPEHYRPQTPIEWGGKRKDAGRKKCKKCGAMMKAKDHVRTMQRQHICPNCHDEVWDKVRTVSDDMPPTPNDSDLVNEPVEPSEASKNQVDFCCPDPLDEEEIEASKPQLEEVSPPSLLPQVANVEVPKLSLTHAPMPPRWLRRKKIWYVWRWELDEKGKLRKVPYQTYGRAPQKAKSNDSTTWTTFEQALAAYEEAIKWDFKEKYDGIGFMCDGSFVGIDLDHCRNKETGEIADWALEIVARFASYTYVTPSDEGLRIIIYGKKPGSRCKKGDIEIYEEGRPFAWRPERLDGTPDEIEECQAELEVFYKEVFPDPLQDATPKNVNFTFLPCSCSAEKILEKARHARNGAKFRLLYDDGKWWELKNAEDEQYYPSQSEADEALCEMLSYWGAGGDVSTIDELFRGSFLMRPKWDEPARAGEGTYGQGTILRAIALAIGEQERWAS